MSKYGINVPKGVAVSSVEEVKETVRSVFPNEKEVSFLSQTIDKEKMIARHFLKIPFSWGFVLSHDIAIHFVSIKFY